MESHNSKYFEPSQEYIKDLIELGFGQEEAILALKIAQNNKEQACELLFSGGSDLETLRALSQIAKFSVDDQQQPIANSEQQQVNQQPSAAQLVSQINWKEFGIGGNILQQPPVSFSQPFETKMVIVLRTDTDSGYSTIGKAAKLVSEAVIQAYQIGLEFDSLAVSQWEMNAWPKIVLRCQKKEDLLQIAENAKSKGLNHFVLEKKIQVKQKEQSKSSKKWKKKQGGVGEESKNINQEEQIKQEESKNVDQEQSKNQKQVNEASQQIEERVEPVVCVVGPGQSVKINEVTGHLKLL